MSEEIQTRDIITSSKNNEEEQQTLAPPSPLTVAATNGDRKTMKRSGSFSLFKTVLVMLRQKNSDKPKQPKLRRDLNGSWKKLVGSMRPFHMQDNPSPPPSVRAASPATTVAGSECYEVMSAPASPAPSSFSGGTMSQYSSAPNLRELDKHDESDEEEDEERRDEVLAASWGDEMIDSKADAFIAQFYQQIRVQEHHF